MKQSVIEWTSVFGVTAALLLFPGFSSAQTTKTLPAPLSSWQDWATWDELPASVPAPFNQPDQKIAAWPSALKMAVTEKSASFALSVRIFHPAWIALPGDAEAWPLSVTMNGQPVAVLAQEQKPCIYLGVGTWQITGQFQWPEMPQQIAIPPNIGILELKLNGQPVELPTWDESGSLWFKRTTNEEADKNFVSAQVYRLLRDGSPMWLDTEVELTVTGKSREETLGTILPEGWQVSEVKSPVPCAVDEQGELKAQVRSGKYTLEITAFRTTPATEIRFAAGAATVVEEELIALQNAAGFRLIEFTGIPAIDVSQTTFPAKWRSFPLHQWNTTQPFQVLEKMRGMGEKKPPGLAMTRQFWLDEDGKQLTYQDILKGQSLQTWRLDVANGQKLGAAKIGGESQLITRNPATNAEGLEVRVRNLKLQAVGRMDYQASIPATGWQTDAESLTASLNLPPGWRLFAVWGADWSRGDWLTAWTLLDVFLLLIFTVAVFRLYGWKAGLCAFGAFVLSYHESGAPRYTWVILLITLAVHRFLPKGQLRNACAWLTFAAAGLVVIALTPFVAKQIQQALYPQLERSYAAEEKFTSIANDSSLEMDAPAPATAAAPIAEGQVESFSMSQDSAAPFSEEGKDKKSYGGSLRRNIAKTWSGKGEPSKNLTYDSKAKIQTGPAVPEWTWRTVSFGWSGPVSAKEKVSFFLIPLWGQRLLTVARVGLLVGLLYGLLRRRDFAQKSAEPTPQAMPPAFPVSLVALVISLSALAMAPKAAAQFPSQEMLNQLRERVLEMPADLAERAQIPRVKLSLQGRTLAMDAEVHCAMETAVPLPGRLPTWSPLRISVDGKNDVPATRKDGYLWIVLGPGIHQVQVEGLVPTGDWEWTFLLKPQYVTVDAPNWSVTGVKPSGIPEAQVFFVEKNRSAGAEATYDRKDFNPILQVHRSLELGLTWRVNNQVQRLSPVGKAISVSLPLLPGERVLSPGVTVEDGRIEIRLGAQESDLSWESELTQAPELKLEAEKNDRWVELWDVTASSTWNLTLGGLATVFEPGQNGLIPTWRPWPGELVTLKIARPEAIGGETMTIHSAQHRMSLGARQRTSELTLNVQTSLGSDFVIDLDPTAEISSLKLASLETPVRKDGSRVIIPLRPGEQLIELAWKTPSQLGFKSSGDRVKLPVDCSNTKTSIGVSADDRWVLWAGGPQRGPAVRFWGLLLSAVLFGFLLGKIPISPLRSHEWILLIIGLTQAPLACGIITVGWLFWLAARGRYGNRVIPALFNLNQIALIASVLPIALILLYVLHQGLLGRPEMWISGGGSSANELKWFQARGTNSQLPMPTVISVSIWFYRGIMLAWAVWLAFAVLRWIRWGWQQLGSGGYWKSLAPKIQSPPPIS
jgi:hypothetical protein